MKKNILSELCIKPEDCPADSYSEINWKYVDSEMSDGQRRFISGLVKYYEPNNVLELGISAGGGSMVLLNALLNDDNWKGVLYSVDRLDYFYRNPEMPVGYLAVNKYGKYLGEKWIMLSGKDPSEVFGGGTNALPEDRKFDFCVIDTYHFHPVESLNFLSVLPRLNDGAVVVIHDTSVFSWEMDYTFLRMYAPRLLLSSVCGYKYIPHLPNGTMIPSNIAAFQVNKDTRKYIQNVFDVLYMPWETNIEEKVIKNVRAIVEKNYGENFLQMYDEAIATSERLMVVKMYKNTGIVSGFKEIRPDTIFYGAGTHMKNLLQVTKKLNLRFDYPIWDINAANIKTLAGKKVCFPIEEALEDTKRDMVVMIEDNVVFNTIKQKYSNLGYHVIKGVEI